MNVPIICLFLQSDVEITKEETIIKEDPGFALRWVSGAIVFLSISYRGSSPYANFIRANFINASF